MVADVIVRSNELRGADGCSQGRLEVYGRRIHVRIPRCLVHSSLSPYDLSSPSPGEPPCCRMDGWSHDRLTDWRLGVNFVLFLNLWASLESLTTGCFWRLDSLLWKPCGSDLNLAIRIRTAKRG